MIPGLTNRILVLDAETASPIDIKKQGQYIYWEHPDTRTLMLGHKWLGAEQAAVTDFERKQQLPQEVVRAIEAPPGEVMLAAANAPFDQAALRRIGYDTPDEKWLDIFTCAYTLGFNGRLNDILRQVFKGSGNIADLIKDPGGTRCITFFSVQQHRWYEHAELWTAFVEYCRKDAQVEEVLLKWCLHYLTKPWFLPWFLKIHQQDLIYRRINRRGLPIDKVAVAGAIKIRDAAQADLLQELEDLTGLENPNSRDQILGWCRAQGAEMANMTKDVVRDEIARLEKLEEAWPLFAEAAALLRALKLRQELAKTSTKKFDALTHATSEDGRLRGGWQFYGASRTGRVAGRVLNPANLATPPDDFPAEDVAEWLKFGDKDLLSVAFPQHDTLTTLSYSIRSMVQAPEGQQIVDADLTSIESIGSAWLVGCKSVLDIFAAGRDTYKTLAALGEGISYEKVTKAQRKFYKPVVLGGVYMLGAKGLVRYAEGFGQQLSFEDAQKQITNLRVEWHEYPEYWRQLNAAVVGAVKNPGRMITARAVKEATPRWDGGYDYIYADWPVVQYWCDGTFLFCKLPSEQFLCYYHPTIEPAVINAGTPNEFRVAEALHYYGTRQSTGGWTKINVHAGSLLENCIAENTSVLTDRGWVPIQRVQLSDLLWDGEQWCHHRGIVAKGKQETIKAHGVRMTPDHSVLTEEGWKSASESERYNRAACRAPGSDQVYGQRRPELYLGVQMRLREIGIASSKRIYEGVQERQEGILRVPDWEAGYPRHVHASSVCSVAVHDRPLQTTFAPGLEKLWSTWHSGVRRLAERLSKFLAGYGTLLPAGADHRTKKQQWKLHCRKLHMGHLPAPGKQQTNITTYRHSGRAHDGRKYFTHFWHKRDDVAVPDKEQRSLRSNVQGSRRNQSVYDLLNCGPRNRFVVRSDDGTPLIVHNCTQALCRGAMWIGLELAEQDPHLKVLGDVYDQVFGLVGIHDTGALDRLISYLTTRAPWMDDTFFLGADGYLGGRFKK